MIIWLGLLVLCTEALATTAYADTEMTASESCVDFIKQVEGFSARPYYDYKQHTVGYGTKCPTEKYFDYMANGISKTEADVLLRDTVASVADTINKKLIQPYQLTFTQHQFDALVSFSFNLGTSWMSYDSSLRNTLLRNANEDDLVYAFALYCTAGGNYSSGLISRRLCEANMYLNGVYSKRAGDAYGYVFYEPNGGSLTYQVQGFIRENHTIPAVEAVRTGDVFLGWYTDLTGGTKVERLDSNLAGKTLFARWQSSENSEDQQSEATVAIVTGDVVNIRKGPGTNYGIAKQVYQNDVLVVSHVTDFSGRKWGKVQDGWICLEYTNYGKAPEEPNEPETEPTEPPSETVPVPESTPAPDTPETKEEILPGIQEPVSGTVKVNDLLRIRSGPGTEYPRVGYLFDGDKVDILEQKTVGSMVWGRISRGWISMAYITTNAPADENITETEPTPTPETQPETQPETVPEESVNRPESTQITGKIVADALRIRSGPGTQNPIVGFYRQKDAVTVLETVQLDGVFWGKTDKGWINMDYVATVPQTDQTPTFSDVGMKTVIADCLRVRRETGTDSRIAALLYYGDTVMVQETKSVDGVLWGRVDKGWICMEYVN